MDRFKNLCALVVVAALLGSATAADGTGLALVKIPSTARTAAREEDDPDGDANGDAGKGDAPEDGATDDGTTEPDLSHPKIQDALDKARKEAQSETEKAKDDEWQNFKANHEKLLGQHRSLKDEVEQIKLAQQAKDAGLDEEKFKTQVETAAQAKYDARKGELDELLKAEKDRADKAEAQVKKLEEREFEAWLDAELVKASIPEDIPQSVHSGAWADLKRRVKPLVERYNAGDGEPFVARIKQNGSIVPGDGPSGHMTLRELIGKARLGKGPLDNVSFLFISSGKGSGTKSAAGVPPRATKWSEMDEKQKAAFTDEHGLEAVKQAISAEYPEF